MEVQEINKEYFFNLIIPCHNPPKEMIKRLFDSLTRQGINKDELIIIIIDDNSNNLEYREWIKEYDLNVFFTQTNNIDIHCPSNARRKGMEFIKGQWLFFCDHDDWFEDNSLKQIKDYINKNEEIYVISTNIRQYNFKMEPYVDQIHKLTWLHGKWYSIPKLIKFYNINFKKDLYTNGDCHFNNMILCQLLKDQKEWNFLDIYTYCWYDNLNSWTRKKQEEKKYLFEHFEDYFIASEPYFKAYKETKDDFFLNQIMMTLLHAYFYYEAAIYYNSNDYKDALKLIKNYLNKILNNFKNININYIINFIYMDPIKYINVLNDCSIYLGPFISNTSFKDFIFLLKKE